MGPKMLPTWTKHGPKMGPKINQKIDLFFDGFWVDFGTHFGPKIGPKLYQNWSQKRHQKMKMFTEWVAVTPKSTSPIPKCKSAQSFATEHMVTSVLVKNPTFDK